MSLLEQLRFGRRLALAMRGQLELAVLRAGLESGLVDALREPRSAEELAEAKGLELDLVEAWLRAAHAHRLLDRHEGRYRRGRYLRWLEEGESGEAAIAMIGQATKSYSPTLARFPDLVRGGDRMPFGLDPEENRRVAIGSRVSEPAALRALRTVPGVRSARRILDVGCGEGTYLIDLLGRHRDAMGTGVEVDPDVAEQARQRIRVTEISRRAQILEGDVLDLDLPRGVFELVLLNNNLHYFDREERRALLEKMHACAAPRGVVCIQTPIVADTVAARAIGARAMLATFDLFLRSHGNLHGLPVLDDLLEMLDEVGFAKSGRRTITPGGMAIYVWARKGEGGPVGAPRAAPVDGPGPVDQSLEADPEGGR